MKLCKDCKNYKGTCELPTGEVSEVTGKAVVLSFSAYLNRRQYGECGPEAKHYDPKLLKRITDIFIKKATK